MLLSWLAGRFRSRAELELEVIALRDQLAILHRSVLVAPSSSRSIAYLERLFCMWLFDAEHAAL